jgi:hypothetical protein
VPKRKPDEVINIRFEMQEHERKLLDAYLTGESIKAVMEGIDKLTSFENLYIIVTVIELVTGKEILPGTPNDVYYIIDAIRGFDISDLFGQGLGEIGSIYNILKDFFNPLSPGFEGDESFL